MADSKVPTDGKPTRYRVPPAPIPEILAARPIPALSISPDRTRLAVLEREVLVGLAELAEPELGLAGVRINPRTNGPSRESYFYGLAFREVEADPLRPVALPEGARLSSPRWSPDGSWLAFALTTPTGIELWVAEVRTSEARRLSGPVLNDTLGAAFHWLPDASGLIAKRVAPGRGPPPAEPPLPEGPVVRESLGTAAPARTYQDLLADPHDEELFEHYFTAELVHLPLAAGEPAVLGAPAVYSDFSIAPGGEHLLVERVVRPYSYLVPWPRFPAEIEVWDRQGRLVRRVATLPLAETVPIAFDAVPTGPRSVQWRADAPATLLWTEALDGGDPRREGPERDRLYLWEAPFQGDPVPFLTLDQRYAGIRWGTGEVALVHSRWWNTRRTHTYRLRPDAPEAEPSVLFDRSFEDRYSDPGSVAMTRTARGQTVILLDPSGEALYLVGEGASPRGDYPFLDRFDLRTLETQRLWRCEDPSYETVLAPLDAEARRILTRRESKTEPPNYYLRDLRSGELRPLTDFPDPAPQLAGIGRQLIQYERADGVKLSATLYTPPGYDPGRDGPLPMLMWAYPREFLDPDAAGQLDDSPNRFSRPSGASHLFLLTQGYAVLDGPAMPIVSRDGEEPNDSYVEQLVMGAAAAVEAVVGLGVADRDRIGIGGHSYGAAMTANLLAHSDLFRAGIARSGAYNRTLTPFGFQFEQRSYWDAPETYHRMSPFSYADRIRHPLLLIHGEADNNTGTYPLQSERFYNALKGHGAIVRYVSLPLESHAYRARESVMHVLAEMVEWMERYVGTGNR